LGRSGRLGKGKGEWGPLYSVRGGEMKFEGKNIYQGRNSQGGQKVTRTKKGKKTVQTFREVSIRARKIVGGRGTRGIGHNGKRFSEKDKKRKSCMKKTSLGGGEGMHVPTEE